MTKRLQHMNALLPPLAKLIIVEGGSSLHGHSCICWLIVLRPCTPFHELARNIIDMLILYQ